jgi:hypothetical protein
MSKLVCAKAAVNGAGVESPPGPLVARARQDEWTRLRAISLRCLHTAPRSFCQWHKHPFEELCLSTDDIALTGKAMS